MAHLYSRGCEYALRALQALARDPGKPATVTQLCRRASVPEHFTRKMLQPLVKAGILKSARGPGGGFTFGREPHDIALLDVVLAIESGPLFEPCVLGMNACEDSDPCPLHHLWVPIRNAALNMLKHRSVADLDGGKGRGAAAAVRALNRCPGSMAAVVLPPLPSPPFPDATEPTPTLPSPPAPPSALSAREELPDTLGK